MIRVGEDWAGWDVSGVAAAPLEAVVCVLAGVDPLDPVVAVTPPCSPPAGVVVVTGSSGSLVGAGTVVVSPTLGTVAVTPGVVT
ncbi:MAG TPA: hypothetical protein VMB91_04630 [Solirubrobacteraceae bacterium]|nr:hypothetical protein [Solirubrobacteraceae bacterium]